MNHDSPMTGEEFDRLDALERRIDAAWEDAALALAEIKDAKLYRRTREGNREQTWEQYCRRVHDITPQWANKLIRRARMLRSLTPESETDVTLAPTAAGNLEGLNIEEQVEVVQEAAKEGRQPKAKDIAEKKYEKLMSRFQPGGDMHGGNGTTKAARPASYTVKVVTPAKGDLEKFGALLPSPITDFNAHSVSGRVGLTDIGKTLAALGNALAAAQPKKVRMVVEL